MSDKEVLTDEDRLAMCNADQVETYCGICGMTRAVRVWIDSDGKKRVVAVCTQCQVKQEY